MIVGSIQNLAQEKAYFTPALAKGLEYLAKTDFSKVDPGKYELDGTNIYALVQEYQTVPKDEKRAEAHRKYLDIQFVYAGAEMIGFAVESPAHVVDEEKLAEKDIIYYSSVRDESDVALTAGMYAILFPNDVHRPGCQYGAPGAVKKVVVKVAMAVL
jgi:biofilm protein TabA